MKISLNEIKKYVEIPEGMSDEELILLIGARLVEVEEVENLKEKYSGVTIAKVVECKKIPETHLSLCKIFAGDENRWADENGLAQVVCGAPNVHAGMLVAWLPPETVVPETFGGENFKLGVRILRGYESNGMLASLKELDLGEEHEGILEISEEMSKMVGKDFAEVFGLNDKILDIENKSLTHRPDTFGVIGFAREVAGILGVKFIEPEFMRLKILKEQATELIKESLDEIEIVLEKDGQICEKYKGVVIELGDSCVAKTGGLTNEGVSLYKADMRPISPLVDLSNKVMLLTGQPLHMFDYDKFMAVGGKTDSNQVNIGVRTGRVGEELELIDGKIVKLLDHDIVITSNDVPVALAGAMGGKNTEVDAGTKRILLESATFSLYNMRKTQMAHGIFTEAITRLTKGLPKNSPEVGMNLAISKLKALYPEMKILGGFGDNLTDEENKLNFSISGVNKILGTNFERAEIFEILENVGLTCEKIAGDKATLLVPYWRTDLKILEDVAEEVGRLSGYDNIGAVLPEVAMCGSKKNALFEMKKKLRDGMSYRLSSHEVLTYSFINEKLERDFEILGENYRIVNSISPDLQIFRKSLVPSLVEKLYENWRAGYEDFSLYEINQISYKGLGLTSEKTPVLKEKLGFVRFGDFYAVKRSLEELMSHLGIEVELVENHVEKSVENFFEPKRSVAVTRGEQKIGMLGEIKQKIWKKMKFKEPIAGFELDIAELLGIKTVVSDFKISKFPKVRRDITVITPKGLSYKEVLETIMDNEGLSVMVEGRVCSIYQKEGDDKISYSFNLTLTNPEKTMTTEEISDIMDKITARLNKLGAEV